jgi:hypothetical protein
LDQGHWCGGIQTVEVWGWGIQLPSHRWFFLKGLKIKAGLFEWELGAFTIFSCILGKKIKLANSENLSSIPPNGACSSFPIAVCDSIKVILKQPAILKIVSKAGLKCNLEKIYNESKGKLEQKFDAVLK